MIGLVLLIALFAFIFYEMYWKRRDLPPGPMPLPLIGNMIGLLKEPPGYIAYERWRKQYGPVYTYWMGSMGIVTCNDYETCKEAFVKEGDAFVDRPPPIWFRRTLGDGIMGIVETSGNEWREQRRFALYTLREFGLGKAEMAKRVLDEAADLLSLLENEAAAGPVAIFPHIDRTVASVINLIIFGHRFETSSPDYQHLRDLFNKMMIELRSSLIVLLVLFPPIRFLPYFSTKYALLKDIRDATMAYTRKYITEHESDVDYSSEVSKDFCEAYLKEMKKREGDVDTSFTKEMFEYVCMDLWSAGLETTNSTLEWTLVYLINHPEVQLRAHEELDRIIGSSEKLVEFEDRTRLPYIQAIVNETQRVANILAQNLFRQASRDVIVGGQVIPKGATCSPQISMLLYDPEVFPDPMRFDPSRFLDDSGVLKRLDEFLPFSIGKRACIGESLARMELFLFTANLLNRFKISAEDPSNPPTMKRSHENSFKPTAFNVVLHSRRLVA